MLDPDSGIFQTLPYLLFLVSQLISSNWARVSRYSSGGFGPTFLSTALPLPSKKMDVGTAVTLYFFISPLSAGLLKSTLMNTILPANSV